MTHPKANGHLPFASVFGNSSPSFVQGISSLRGLGRGQSPSPTIVIKNAR